MRDEWESIIKRLNQLGINTWKENGQVNYQQKPVCILNGEENTCIIGAPDYLKLNQEANFNAKCVCTQEG